MQGSKLISIISSMILISLLVGCQNEVKNIERPEKIVSKREVVYNLETYSKLAKLWSDYYKEFPSEDAYANWMYASRYAKLPEYESLLSEGIVKYSANPTLLYLKALLKHGEKENLENLHLLERATKLDPSYLDPWFALTINYLEAGDMEKLDVALRHILEGGAIADEILDYNYNVLTLLEKNSILITNGDNDTYPGWILTRILKYRTDIKIVNRSLLNTEWYPALIKNETELNFITQENLNLLRKGILDNIKKAEYKSGPFSDTLITYIVETAKDQNRPIYFASTLYSTDIIKRYKSEGRNLGLVTLITPSKKKHSMQIEAMFKKWIKEFRVGGLNSWKLRYGNKSLAGKRIVMNYAASIYKLMDEIKKFNPELRLELFYWYRENLSHVLNPDYLDKINETWCKSNDINEISDWCY